METTINTNDLRQTNREYGKVIYYQPLNSDFEEKRRSAEMRKIVRIQKSSFRCYECKENFLTIYDRNLLRKVGKDYSGIYRREHWLKVVDLSFSDGDSWSRKETQYFKALCCKCSNECDCQDWITKNQREYEAEMDRVKRKLKTMKRISEMLNKEFEFVQYEEEKEVIKNTINWNLSEREIKQKTDEIERIENTLQELEGLKSFYETRK